MQDALAELSASIGSRRLRRILQDWDGWRGARPFPARADFVPEQIKYLLGNVVLLDVLRQPLRFRYRLIGTNLVARRYELTGRTMDQHPDPEFRPAAIAFNTRVVEERRPLRFQYRILSRASRGWIDYESLNMPLSADGAEIDMILCAIAFNDEVED